MSNVTLYMVPFVLLAVFVVGFWWLWNVFKRRMAPHHLSFGQRWLAVFAPGLPLTTYGGYLIFHTSQDALLLSVGFGISAAAAAAAFGATRRFTLAP